MIPHIPEDTDTMPLADLCAPLSAKVMPRSAIARQSGFERGDMEGLIRAQRGFSPVIAARMRQRQAEAKP